MTSPRYTVVLRGEHRFMLSKNQIEHDSPAINYFASCFLADFMEAESKLVELDQDPALFALIVQHMSGYRIIPIPANYLPPGMTQEVAMENLVRDAKFFGLEGLYKLLTVPALPPHIQGWDDCYINGPVVEFEDVIYGRLPPGTLYTQDGLCTMVDGVALPALVYGRNMPLSIHWEWHFAERYHPDMPDMIPEDKDGYTYTFSLQLLPSQVQNLVQRHADWSKKIGTNRRLNAESAYDQDVSICINGRRALMSSLELWLDQIRHPPQERTKHPQYEEFRVFEESFPGTILTAFDGEPLPGVRRLWGDGFFFVIRFDSSSQDSSKGPIKLLLMDIRAKTRGVIMEAAFPPF